MNSGIVGALVYRALYNYIPCQEYFCIVNNKTIGFCIVNNGIMNSGMVGELVYRVLYNNITLPGVFYGNLCIVNNGIMNS